MPEDNYNNDYRKHLDFIQSVITRMNTNSFMIKGWAITLVSALMALAATSKNNSLLYISVIPIVGFCVLDTFFLQSEKKLRSIYKNIIANNSLVSLYEINLSSDYIKTDKNCKYWNVFLSKTIIGFYLTIFVLNILVILILTFSKTEISNPTSINVTIQDTLNLKEIGKTKNYNLSIDTLQLNIPKKINIVSEAKK